MGRVLMLVGALIFLSGLAIQFAGRYLKGWRLPGDILIQKGNFTLYFPLMTSLIISLVLTGVLWLLRK